MPSASHAREGLKTGGGDFAAAWASVLAAVAADGGGFAPSAELRAASPGHLATVLTIGDRGWHYAKGLTADDQARQLRVDFEAKERALTEAMQTVTRTAMENAEQTQQELKAQLAAATSRCRALEEAQREAGDLERLRIEREAEQRAAARCAQTHELAAAALRDQVEVLKRALDSATEDKRQVQARYDELNQKLPHMSMSAMGSIGEDLVADLLRDAFGGECDVKAVNREAHGMDVRLTTPSGLNAKLEVKAASPVRTDRDVSKFHRNVDDAIQAAEVNACVLVSLKAAIPNYKSGTVHFRKTADGLQVPVMYLHVTSAHVLKHAALALRDIQQLCYMEHAARGAEPMPLEVQKCHEERVLFRQLLPELFREGAEEEDQVGMQLEHLKRAKELAEARLARLQIVRQAKLRLQESVPWLFETGATAVTASADAIEKAVALFEKYHEQTGKDPANLAAFGADEPFVKRVGMGKLKEIVRLKRKERREGTSTAVKMMKTHAHQHSSSSSSSPGGQEPAAQAAGSSS